MILVRMLKILDISLLLSPALCSGFELFLKQFEAVKTVHLLSVMCGMSLEDSWGCEPFHRCVRWPSNGAEDNTVLNTSKYTVLQYLIHVSADKKTLSHIYTVHSSLIQKNG